MLIDSTKDLNHNVELSYITNGINWSANYVVLLGENDTTCDINGWVTINNNCGTTFTNADLTLVAGDVNRIQPKVYRSAPPMSGGIMMDNALEAKSNGFNEESFFEYHLYKLGRKTTVKSNEVSSR